MKKRTKKLINYNAYGWFFVSFALILFCVFTIYPAFESIWLSFQTFDEGAFRFSGLDNFKRMLGDKLFFKSMANTFLFLIIQVPIMKVLALSFATMLNKPKLKARGILRTAIFLPCVTSLVAYSVLFKMMFSMNGIVNNVLMSLDVLSESFQWLQNPIWAKIIIIIALTWRWTGYDVIFFLAAMQNIPAETYEAAQIDGSNSWNTFWKITLPQLKPIILLTMIMSTNGTLQLFDEPMNITMGGPANSTLTMSQYIYNQSFVYSPNLGYSATLSYVIVFIMIILAIIQFRITGDDAK
ncbi:MAG: sugar ABC transporter permease [Anaerolineaceae bacterium]|nr:MAG: sugar ABC transporter permease [Anaerolineaceae bacterium]